MEKKNTMLLTVIAVATLLVAVVGATFAYFSLSVSGNAKNTTAEVKSSSVGLVSLSGGGKTLELSVTAEDMKQPAKDEYYYAMDKSDVSHSTSSTTGGKYLKETDGESHSAPAGSNHELAKFTVTGGDENDEYTCGYKVKVTATGDMLDQLQAGDINLTIEGAGLGEGSGNVQTNLKDLTGDSGSKSKEFNGSIKLEGQGESGPLEETINATMYLVNSAATDQSTSGHDLAGKTLNLTIEVTATDACTISQKVD